VAAHDRLQIKTILVPLDFSAASMQALDYAIPFAEQFHSAMHLLYVHERDDEFSPCGDVSHLLFESAEARTQLRRPLAHLQREHALPFRAADCHVQFGRAPRKACELARKLEADLIVVASRGRTGLPRILLGSTAERIVRQAPCPVLVARQREAELDLSEVRRREYPIRNILVPVDFSDLSIKAIEYAADLAKAFSARLHLFHASFPHGYFVADRNVHDPATIRRAEMTAARGQIEKIARSERLGGVRCETAVRSGYPIREICGAIARAKADLVVTASHGLSGLKHAVLGSVAEHIIRYAECPVLVLPRASRAMN
jgi:nucleotide-binding universal stress UspA family protein